MRRLKCLLHVFALICLLAPITTAVPALAGQTEIDLLASYAGDWKGSALLTGGDEPETFTCRLSITKSRQARIFYTGRCALAGLNLAVNGVIAYNDDARRYEAAMTSNTAFSGVAIGKRRGDTIEFDLQERGTREKGGEVTIGAKILLKENKVTVDFDIEFSDSGEKMKTSVPLTR